MRLAHSTKYNEKGEPFDIFPLYRCNVHDNAVYGLFFSVVKNNFIIYLFLRHCREEVVGVLVFRDVILGPSKPAFQSSLHVKKA